LRKVVWQGAERLFLLLVAVRQVVTCASWTGYRRLKADN